MKTNQTNTMRFAHARQLVDEAYARWLSRTENTTAAAILVQCEIQLRNSQPADAGSNSTAGNGPLSVKQAADELGVSPETVYKLCAENGLRHTRIGRRITISRQHLEIYRDGHRFRHLAD